MAAPLPPASERIAGCGWETLSRHVAACVLPRIVIPASIAFAITVLVHKHSACQFWPSFCSAQGEQFLFIHPYAYQGIMLCSGFGLVFRLNHSYNRYWEARTAVQNAGSKWADACVMSYTFDDDAGFPSSVVTEHAKFARTLTHLASLMHAVAMHSLRGDASLETLHAAGAASCSPTLANGGAAMSASKAAGQRAYSLTNGPTLRARGLCESSRAASKRFAVYNPILVLGGVTTEERKYLEASNQKVHLVLGWIHRLLVRRRRRGGLAHDAPIVSRIYQVLSDGMLWWLGAAKVCDTPFPLAYAQLLFLICLINLGIFPVIVADKVASLPLAATISTCGMGLLFGLNEVARELEEPFASTLGIWMGANRLDASALQELFDERLLACGSATVLFPPWWQPIGQALERASQEEEAELDLYGDFLADALNCAVADEESKRHSSLRRENSSANGSPPPSPHKIKRKQSEMKRSASKVRAPTVSSDDTPSVVRIDEP